MSEAGIQIAASVSAASLYEALQPSGQEHRNGPPGQPQSSEDDASRGPDAIVELSGQAADTAQADSDTQNDTAAGEKTEDQEGSDKPADASRDKATNGRELTEEQQEQVDELKERDQEVRRHEQAHKAAAGSLARGGPAFSFQRGPDGKQYAVGGEVQIDTSPVEGDPAATIRKMEAVRRAALSPAEPSSQDRAVAAQAARTAQQARQELRKQSEEEGKQAGASSTDSSAQASAGGQDQAADPEAAGAAASAPGSSSSDFSTQNPGTGTVGNQTSGRLLDVYI